MLTVWKYEITADDYITLRLPVGAKILSVQEQHGKPCMWCLVNDKETVHETRIFRFAGTGHPIKDKHTNYIGTFQLFDGSFIGHIFEVLP